MLFLLYIADLTRLAHNLQVHLYADDTQLGVQHVFKTLFLPESTTYPRG